MATGNPLLLTWRGIDKTFRMYEFSNVSGFVQIATGSSGSYTGVGSATEREGLPPFFSFMDDSKSVIVISNMDYGSSIYRAVRRLHDPDTMNQKSNTLLVSVGEGSAGNNTVFRDAVDISDITNYCLSPASDLSGTVINACAIYDEVNLVATETVVSNNGGVVDSLKIHPKDEFLYVCATPTLPSRLIPRKYIELVQTGYPNDVKPVFIDNSTLDNARQTITLREVVGDIVEARWSKSGKYLYLFGRTGMLYAYEIIQNPANYDEYSAKLHYAQELTTDTIVTTSLRKDTHLALSQYNTAGDSYSTVVYRIVGPNLIPIITISGFGKCLDWSADGSMLIDAGTKRLFTFNESTEVLTENSIWMTNIAAAIEYQAISTHAESVVYVGHVYTEAAKLVAEQSSSINLSSLKIMLLDKFAKFNPNILNINQLSTNGSSSTLSNGGAEVYSEASAWPQGGIAVNNASYAVNGNGEVSLIADNFERIVLDDITFQHAVIYDSVTNMPIIWYEFMQEVTVDAFKKMIFNLEQYGIVSFK